MEARSSATALTRRSDHLEPTPIAGDLPIMSRPITRRSCLKSAAAAATLTVVPAGLVRGYAANESVNVGIIGVGGVGGGNRRHLRDVGANIVALCDVDRKGLVAAQRDHRQAKTWRDFRKMLDTQKEIDAVMISTPDHTHAVASMAAMKRGKHVCTEKPLTHSVYEARMLGEAARKYQVATQMDNESHGRDEMRAMVECLRSGAIGKVSRVHIWSNRPIWPQGFAERPPAKPVPDRLDWDLWLGPAPYRDYHDGLHPFKWRGFWDFGTGALGDMGCHQFDSAFWALELGHPKTVEAVSEGNNAETGPTSSIVTYEFPARGDGLPPVTLTWYDGKELPPRPEELPEGEKLPASGSLFVGENGKILVHNVVDMRLLPAEKYRDIQPPEPFLPRSPGHRREWLEACRGGKPPGSNFADYSGPMTEVVLLGNVALRLGRRIEWDPENLRALNAPEADQYLRREYRKGWEL
jgi:predicted dehydrogenase